MKTTKNTTVIVRVSSDDKKRWQATAERLGLNLSQFINYSINQTTPPKNEV